MKYSIGKFLVACGKWGWGSHGSCHALPKLIIVFVLFVIPFYVEGSFEGRKIHKVTIIAAEDFDISEIETKLSPLKGKRFSETSVNSLIKTLYLTERFHNISVHVTPLKNGKINLSFVFELAKQIDSIEFKGNQIFEDIVLLRSIVARQGGLFDEALLLNDKFALEKLYEEAGYFNAKIQIHFFSPQKSHFMNVIFDIEENKPTLVRQLIVDSAGRPKSKELRPIISLGEGEIFRLPELKKGIVDLKNYFFQNKYLDADVFPEVLTYNADKSEVQVYLKIIPGFQYSFEIQGSLELSEYELLSPLREDEETARFDISQEDIIKHIVSSYKKKGFFNVEVSQESYVDKKRNRKLVILKIQEGRPVKIRDFIILGNKAYDQEFYKTFIETHGSPLILKKLYDPKDVEEMIKVIVDHLKTRGFLFAKASIGSLLWDSSKTTVSPEIKIEEGPQTVLKKINLSGNRYFADPVILEHLDLPLHSPLNLFQIDIQLKKIIDLYTESGFLEFKIEGLGAGKMFVYSPDFKFATLDLKLQEGPQMKVGNIIFRGAIQTRHRVLERELTIQKGDFWNPKEIQRSENEILRLGLFSSAKISPLLGDFQAGENDVVVEVTERMPGLMEFGGGFSTDEGARIYAGVAYRNLGGWNRVLSARALVNRPLQSFKFLEREITLGFSEPYLGGIPFVARLNMFHLKQATLPFDESSWKAKLSLDKWLWHFLHFDFRYSYEFRHIFRAIDPDDLQKNIAASVGPTLQFDFRDDAFNPASGSLHSISSLFYLPEIGSNRKVHLVRNLLTTTWYLSPWHRLLFALSGRAGYARSLSSLHPIPVDLRYYLGGRSTIRGFKEDIIGSDTRDKKIFENSFLNYRAEARFNVFEELGLAFFVDGGNVFFDDIDTPTSVIGKFRHSIGPGLRYNTPIGPLSLDFGFILSRDKIQNEPIGRLHFSIGQF